jgi:hypothetical protein
MRLGFPAGATIPLTAPGMWYSTADNNFHVFDGVTDRTLESLLISLSILSMSLNFKATFLNKSSLLFNSSMLS